MTGFGTSATARTLALAWLMGAVLFFLTSQVDAQSLRDPTLPPAEAGLAGSEAGAKPMTVEPGAMVIIVRNGRPFVVVDTRLYAPGQQLGQARIERISETEVWLREAGVLRKVPQFPGIQRSTVAPTVVTPDCTANGSNSHPGSKAAKSSKASKTSSSSPASSPVAPCADVQPGGPSP